MSAKHYKESMLHNKNQLTDMDPAAKIKEEKAPTAQHQHLHSHHQQQLHQQLQSSQTRHHHHHHHQSQQQQQQQFSNHQLQALLTQQNKTNSGVIGSDRHTGPNVAGAASTQQSDNSLLIQELAQLISQSITADMNTPPLANISTSGTGLNKADKCGSGAQQIKTETTNSGNQSSNAVQQSHVSSSKPLFVPNDLLGSILLKALNGFLFVVNCQGNIEFISENVTQFLRYTQEELVGKIIYNIIHVGDHSQFSNSLLPMTLTSGLAWPSDAPTIRGCNFNCRMLVKPPVEEEEDVEVKQTYVSQYENMQITAILQSCLTQKLTDSQLSSPFSREDQTCLLCIARRLPLNEKNNMMLGGVNLFSTKQDLHGKIIRAETSHDIIIPEGSLISDLCHVNDIQQLNRHCQEVLKNGHNTSGVYRFKAAENRYVFVQTKSKLFNNHVTGEPEFIMSTHSIIRECDSDVELKGSVSSSFMKSCINQSANRQSSMNLGNLTSNLTATLPSPLPNMDLGGSLGMNDAANSELDALVADLEIFNNLPSENLDIKPMMSDGNSGPGSSSWGPIPTLKSPASTSAQSPLQYALQAGVGSNSGQVKRPPMLNMVHRSSSVTTYDGSQKNPRLTPSPGSGPRSAGFNQRMMGSYSNQRSPASLAMGSNSNLQQNRNQGGQFTMGFQRKTSVSPLMSPQSGYPPSPAGWGRSPASVPATPPSSGDFTSLNTPLGVSLPSPLHNLPSQDTTPQPGLTGLDISVSRSVSTSGFPSSSFLSVSSPSFSSGMDLNGQLPQSIASMAGSNSSSNTGMSSHRLCQLLTQNTTPEQLHSPASMDGRRPIISRGLQATGQIGSSIPTSNPVSSSKSIMGTSSASMAGLGSELHRPSSSGNVMKSPDDHLHQSPTEGPGQSPPQKPQSTSNDDGEMDVVGLSGMGIRGLNDNSTRGVEGGVGDRSNYILKGLLSQDDDDEPSLMDPSMSSPPISSGGHSAGSLDFHSIGEKNEAEPRKPNALLKQLLGEEGRQKLTQRKELTERLRREIVEHGAVSSLSYQKLTVPVASGTLTISTAANSATKKRKLSTGQEILNQLLDECDDDSGNAGTTSAPAESTSMELDTDPASRSRHQSEHQEPQSTSAPASHSEPCTPQGLQGQKRHNYVNDIRRGQQLDELLHTLWSKDDFSPKQQQHQMPSSSSNNVSSGNTKRPKVSLPDVDSSDGVSMDMEPSTSSGGSSTQQSELSQKNALLAQLLSKKAQRETVVNTHISINPTGIPQNRYPRNLRDKVITIKSSDSVENSNSEKGTNIQSGDNQGSLFQGGVSNSSIGMSNNTNSSSSNNNMPNFLNGGFSGGHSSVDTDSNMNGMDIVSADSQLSQFQSLLDGDGALFSSDHLGNSVPVLSRAGSNENDPLLHQILQQVEDLQNELQKVGNNSSLGQSQSVGLSSTSGIGGIMGSPAGGLNINTNMTSVTSIAQALTSSLQPSVQNRMNPLQQQQERLQFLSNQKLQQQLLQQKQLQQKSQDSMLTMPQQQQVQQQQPFLSPPQQPSSTTSVQQPSLTSIPLSSSSVSSSSQLNMSHHQQPLLAEMDLNDESSLVAQLEEILKETGNWPNLDNYMSNTSQSLQDQANEQLVIDDIKRRLMEDPLISPQHQQHQMIGGIMDNNAILGRQNLQHSLQQQLQGGMPGQQQQQLGQIPMGPAQNMSGYSQNAQGLRQGIEGAYSPGMQGLPQQQLRQQQQPHQQQPGFTPPRGPLATALQLRPAGLNTSSIMVRQNLLYQQRHRQIDRQKQDRERQQRLLQQQQQQRLQVLPQQFNQRFNQAGIPTIDSTPNPQAPFPDNLRELMTQGHPPNVTLPVQRGLGMPGPMSPRFSGPSPQASQLSPHFSPQPGSGGGWTMRPQGPTDPLVMQQGNQFSPNMNRQRSLSGNSLPSPGNQQQQQPQQAQFQFTDGGQFVNSGVGNAGGAGQLSGLFSPSQQQQQGAQGLFQQARMMQRMPTGRGSPRGPHSPFGTSPTDPLLISPQAVMSPNSGMRQAQQGVQVSPQYSQVPMSTGYGGQSVGMPGGPAPFQGGSSHPQGVPSFSPGGNMTQSASLHEFDLQFFDSALSSLESKNLSSDMGVGGAGPSTSQYVKQELRNICSARSEKQQQQQQQSQLHALDFDNSSSELPPDILETINDMSKEHGGPLSGHLDESEVVSQTRLEARQRFEQFQRISASGQALPVTDPSEEAGVKATVLFRNQLLRPVHGTPSPVPSGMKQISQSSIKSGDGMAQINIQQSEARTSVDDIRPIDNRNSLLCQLLSE